MFWNEEKARGNLSSPFVGYTLQQSNFICGKNYFYLRRSRQIKQGTLSVVLFVVEEGGRFLITQV